MKTPHVIKSIGNHLKPAHILVGSIAALLVVQTSSDLQAWNDVPDTDPNLTLTDYSASPSVEASVKYTLPTGAAKSFVRLKVIPK